MLPQLVILLFVFAFGACVGSFLNVVVWRLPRGKSLISPPSHCPMCGHGLAWYDNIPVLGWLMLRGRCRYCATDVSARYPTIEFLTGAIFVFYYFAFYHFHVGPCAPRQVLFPPDDLGRIVLGNAMPRTLALDWPIYVLYMFLLACLLAASLIDAELFIIPLEIPWLAAGIGVIAHAIVDRPSLPGALSLHPSGLGGALAAGGGIGLIVSMVMFMSGKLPASFPEGEPQLEVDKEDPDEKEQPPGWLTRWIGQVIHLYRGKLSEKQVELRRVNEKRDKAQLSGDDSTGIQPPARQWTKAQVRAEIRKEIQFLLFPLSGAFIAVALIYNSPAAWAVWERWMGMDWLGGMLGSVLGALVGGLVVWTVRIIGTLVKGQVAMGLGDVHLMLGVGAIIGAGPVTLAFFLAPFPALVIGLYNWIARNRRELPFGPYLSLATAIAVLCYCPIADRLRPGMIVLWQMIRSAIGL